MNKKVSPLILGVLVFFFSSDINSSNFYSNGPKTRSLRSWLWSPIKTSSRKLRLCMYGTCTSKNKHNDEEDFVPIAVSGNNNVYLVWPSNKTTPDFEIMFKALTDGGKTFEPKINLSNSTGIDSERPEIAAFGNNVYVTWWERNQTSNEPVLGVSNDSGKTFGEKIMLSAK